MSDDGSSSSFAWSGNPRRALWKRACTAAALSPSLPPTERALYAALAPAQQTAAVLRGACRTWADHLWASVVGACERKLGAELVRVGAGSWEKDEMASSGADGEGEGDADANPAGGRQAENTEMDLDQQQNQGGNQDDEGEDEAWAEEWRSLIANLETQPVEEG
jgi:nuclear pore complex protein Nup107